MPYKYAIFFNQVSFYLLMEVIMEKCAVKDVLDILDGKWKLHIIWELCKHHVIRFNELRRRLHGISNIMLSKSLRELESSGVIKRIQYNEVPPRVEYTLTEQAMSLCPILDQLEQWGKKMKDTN